MSAIASDIVAAQRPGRVIKREDAAIKASYPGARDNVLNPSEGFFDIQADAFSALNIEGSLIGTARRRFAVAVQDLVVPDPIAGGVPTYDLIDAEQDVDTPCLLSRVVVDLETETTAMELFG